MKTIEERIETIISEEIGNLDHPSFDLKYEIEAALKRMSLEQKAIDDVRIAELESFVKKATELIEMEKAVREHLESVNKELIDKACKYTCKKCNITTIDDVCVLHKNPKDTCMIIKGLIKAMEE